MIEIHNGPVVHQLRIAKCQPHHKDGKQSAAVHKCRNAVGQYSESDGQHRIQPGGIKINSID
ncbi:hypothetical protein D3C73_1551460 [compost metagenome]